MNQPLLHFLALGGALFLIFEYLPAESGATSDSKDIVIDRVALLEYMQYRHQAFNQEHFARQLETMQAADRQRLIEDLVRDEVLYREALAMRLDDNDYVIKRRLIQKLEFITQGFITADADPSEAEITGYFNENIHDYYMQPAVTFSHVFIDYERHGRPQAGMLAGKTLQELNERRIAYSEGVQFGDRFPYFSNYVKRPLDYVAGHFGPAMAQAIFNLEPDHERWHGPFESEHGLHLVMLTGKEAGRVPELSEIRERVREDAKQALVRRQTEAAINEIIRGYKVKIAIE
jgi:hypothetical protein